MPYALVTIGLILIITGARDTYSRLGQQLQSDFSGNQNFVFWVVAIGSVGAVGYVQQLRTFATTFMALIIVALLLSEQKNGSTGFFGKFITDLKAGPDCAAASASPSTNQPAAATPSNSGVTFSAPTASGRWQDMFKGGPLDFLSHF
jgi:hypothetical protein